VRGETRQPVLEAHRALISECSEHARFRGGLLVELEDGEWLDVAIWNQEADRSGPARVSLCDLVDRIDWADTEILGQETGSLAGGCPRHLVF
jgi:hypothetical protein